MKNLIINCKTLLNFANAYDDYKYPFGLYKDLVIDSKANRRRFELLGAWKTGAIRIVKNGSEYQDTLGNQYGFTRRWAAHTPVGYSVWKSLDASEPLVEVPASLSSQVPNVILNLTNLPGFGFIWALFVAHICRPNIYPLYDQHVWRAFRNISSRGIERPTSAPNKWSEFIRYSEFFHELLRECEVAYWKLDQALWVYGKSLKRAGDRSIPQRHVQNLSLASISDQFIHSLTLGRSKAFWWFIDKQYDIHIGRTFKNSVTNIKVVRGKLIGELFEYLSDRAKFPKEKFPLANNVEKLKKGSEVSGIGKFLYKNGFSTTESQLAGHLAAIFYGAGIWCYNEKKRCQLYWFSVPNIDWRKKVRDYYTYLLQYDDD
jgi:hypothetical protein